MEARLAGGASATTINRSLEVVRTILNRAARSYRSADGRPWLEAIPPLITMLPESPRLPYPITWKEQDTLFRKLPAHLGRMALFAVKVFLTINGKLQYLWRAVDQDGDVLDILVQLRRNKKAAKKFFRKLLKGLQYVPRAIVTDKLRSYAAAKAEVMPSVEHQQQGRLNNRAENSHQPTRERERRMRGFKSSGHAQQFLSIFGVIGSSSVPAVIY